METGAKPAIRCELHHAILSVGDVQASADFYADRLGFIVAFTEGDPPRFAGVNLDCVQIFLRKGTPTPLGCSVYFVVGDADELHGYHCGQEVTIVAPPGDRPYGLRDYTVRDLDGYHLTFGHRLPAGR
jgi:catechol 2,3-dioxygenase-like lactoylglutathione lyase family enzyme